MLVNLLIGKYMTREKKNKRSKTKQNKQDKYNAKLTLSESNLIYLAMMGDTYTHVRQNSDVVRRRGMTRVERERAME